MDGCISKNHHLNFSLRQNFEQPVLFPLFHAKSMPLPML